jgi:hypothetical protein
MKPARYENTRETVPVGELQTNGAFTLGANTASSELVQGVYWLTPVSLDCWVRIDDGTTNPVAKADDNALITFGQSRPVNIATTGLKIISSQEINVAKA